jgi:hypothetical protein|uniref:hypothetical protein n=1 Tax=Prosthecobacter sp. TaxID=1965333 RepID=UPI003783E0E3
MKKFVRLLLFLLGLLVLLAVAAPLAGAYILRRYVNKELIVLETEKNINARVHLDDVTLTIFAWPPSLRLAGVKIGPRDQYAGTPLAARPPMKNAPVQIDMAYAELVPEALMSRQFFPRVLRIVGIEVHERISPQDGSALEKLFQPPPDKLAALQAAADVPRAIPVQTPPPVAAEPAAPGPVALVPPAPAATPAAMPVEAPDEGSRAGRVILQEISIEQGHFVISNEGTDSRFNADISDFTLVLTGIDIDPADIANHNKVHARLSAKAIVDGAAQIGGRLQEVKFADMKLHGEGDVNPVDPATMRWSPAAMLNLVIDRGSSIGGHMTIGDAAGQNLDKLMKYGVDLSAIRIGGVLAQDVNVSVLFGNESIRFLGDTLLALPDYEFTIKKDSWIDLAKDQQGLLTRLSCGDALKEQIVRGVASRGLGDTISRMVVGAFSDDRGRVAFDLSITGSLSHPQVKPDIQNRLEGLLGGDIEEKAKGLINNFKELKGLFKNF